VYRKVLYYIYGIVLFFQVLVYEAMRLFRDKLVCEEDQSQFDSIITRVLESEWSRDLLLEKLSGIHMFMNSMIFWGRSLDSSVSKATGCRLDGLDSIPGSARIFSSPQRPDQLWGQHSLLSIQYWGLFPQG
jgi:hypothetical protein